MKNLIENWKPKVGDTVAFKKEDYTLKFVMYKVVRSFKDKNGTVIITRIVESKLEKVLNELTIHPVLKWVVADIQTAVSNIIGTKLPDYDWRNDDTISDLITTQEKYLRPVGKTYLDLHRKV